MVDSNNLQASADIRVTAVVLIIVTVMNLLTMSKSLRNLKYKQAQLLLISIYLMPIVIGWVAWIQMMNTSELRSIWFTLTLIKAVCLACFLAYIERMIGWTIHNGENIYTKETLYQNLVTHRSPICVLKCIKIRSIDSVETARWYIERIRSFVYQLCAVFVSCSLVGIIFAIATHDSKLNKGEGPKLFLILSGATSVSSIVALNGLLNFGMYAKSLPVLSNLKIMHKFVIIKLGLLFTEFQPLVIAIFVYTGTVANTDKFSHEEIILYTNSLLVVSEMIIMSFLIVEVYPLSDYDSSPDKRKSFALLCEETEGL